MIPEGITAELSGVRPVTWCELSRFRFAHESPEAREHFLRESHIDARVVESNDPDVEVGDVTSTIVNVDGATFDELKQKMQECKGAVLTLTQKIFRFFGMESVRGHCGTIDNRRARS